MPNINHSIKTVENLLNGFDIITYFVCIVFGYNLAVHTIYNSYSIIALCVSLLLITSRLVLVHMFLHDYSELCKMYVQNPKEDTE